MPAEGNRAIANAVKRNYIRDLLSRGLLAVDELNYGYGICDVFAVSRAGFACEWELKLERQDLRSELHTIAALCSNNVTPGLYKYDKHRRYLRGSDHDKGRGVPNYYSFLVPEELMPVAQPIVSATEKYGLYVFRVNDVIPSRFQCVIRPKALHTNKFQSYQSIARKMCFRYYFGHD